MVYVDNKITEIRNLLPTNLNINDINNRLDDHQVQIANINQKITLQNHKLSAGVASAAALALMPTPPVGGHYFTGSTASYNGQGALAIGLTGASETGKFIYKVGGSLTSRGAGAFGFGVGYRWK